MVAVALATTCSTTPAPAEGPPWRMPGQAPLGENVSSARVLAQDEAIYFEPDAGSPRRGSAMRGAYLPVYASAHGAGCKRPWLLVGPEAWICGERVEPSQVAPTPARGSPEPLPNGLPLDYYFVGAEGTFGYDALTEADVGAPDAQLEPGFAVGIIDVSYQQSEAYGLTTKGLWLPMRDLGPARPSHFSGVSLRGDEGALGWVDSDDAAVYDTPGGRRADGRGPDRRTLVRILERVQRRGRSWLRIDEKRWLHADDVRVITLEEVPSEVGPLERWIDVDLGNQIVIAHVGSRPVFATLASTGKGRGHDAQATPTGIHRIWVKLRTSDMTNLEDTDASRYYAMEEVPWVMYFDKGYGLHGAYWHDSFGRVRSHGCVNLAPRDAEWLFHWAGPHLPAGWRAVLPTAYDPGTLVRVRGASRGQGVVSR